MAPDQPRGPGGGMPRQAQQQQYAPSKELKAQNEFELFDKLIRGGADIEDEDGLDEFDDSLPTANHSKTETDLTRSKRAIISNYRQLLNCLGLTPQKSEFIKEQSKGLMFINQSSKAKKGFGDLLVRTDHVYQTVDEYSKADFGQEEGGVVDSLKESVGQAVGGQQVIGDPAENGYLSQEQGRQRTW